MDQGRLARRRRSSGASASTRSPSAGNGPTNACGPRNCTPRDRATGRSAWGQTRDSGLAWGCVSDPKRWHDAIGGCGRVWGHGRVQSVGTEHVVAAVPVFPCKTDTWWLVCSVPIVFGMIYGPDTPAGTLRFLQESLRKKFGNRVRFIPHE